MATTRFSLAWITIGALGVITIVFLAQQAIWLKQFGTADWQRRRADLQSGAERLAPAFDAEMQALSAAYRLDEDAVRRNDWRELAERVARAQSPIVDDVYLLDESAAVRRWNGNTFQAAPRPERLRTVSTYAQPFDEQAFALIVPIAISGESLPVPAGAPVMMMVRIPMQAPAAVVVTLDRDALARVLLPALLEQHLPQEEAPYRFAVKSRESGKVLFASDGTMRDAKPETSDAAVNLLTVNRVIDASGRATSFLPASAGVAIGVVEDAAQPMPPSSPPIPPSGGTMALPRNAGQPPALLQLLIRHPSGSLQHAVTQVRRRNLAISIVALLLLAGSAVAMAISSHRARTLVDQQMEFVGGVTHELRTPVAVVCMTASNLADGVVQDPERIREYGQLIQAEGQRLSRMIDQILSFAGADSDPRGSRCEIVPAAMLIDDALASLRAQLAAEGFQVDVRIDPTTPAVFVDLAGMRRALQNLLTNAMKYSGDSRHIEIVAAPDASGKEVAIRIIDAGIGIAEDDVGKIFEPFRRGRGVSSIPGSGLGLSIVERIVHAHDGRVDVKSAVGHGSTFTIHLPAVVAVTHTRS